MLTDKQVEDGFSYEPEYEYANPVDTGYVQRNRRAFREWKAEVERAAAARAWDEGRESVAHDLMQPAQSDGTKPPSVNPYRAAEIREGKP